MKKTATLFFLLISGTASAQFTWEKVYGGVNFEQLYGIAASRTGDVFVYGLTGSFGIGYADGYLLRINSAGDTIFTHTYGNQPNEGIADVCETFDNGLIIATADNANAEFIIIKTDAAGNVQWANAYDLGNVDVPRRIIETSDSCYVICGNTVTISTFQPFMIKIDQNGNVIWSKIYDFGINLQHDFMWVEEYSGALYAAGIAVDSTLGNGVLLAKLDTNGFVIWAEHIDSPQMLIAPAIDITSTGQIMLSGHYAPVNNSNSSGFLMKFDPSGALNWAKIYGLPNDPVLFTRAIEDEDKNMAISGIYGTTAYHALFVKTDSSGNLVNTTSFGLNTLFHDIELCESGYIAAGVKMFAHDTSDIYSFYVVRMDNSGNSMCSTTSSLTVGPQSTTLVQLSGTAIDTSVVIPFTVI
ncbi:MAG TPA: hypothetical protein VI731_03630, partial [Bacteroidia bacterium]|nr:hypothetical protein [Bacteroidia bacterium]